MRLLSLCAVGLVALCLGGLVSGAGWASGWVGQILLGLALAMGMAHGLYARRETRGREAADLAAAQERERADLAEMQYRELFGTMAQGVVYQSPDGRILDANPAAERVLGLSLDQMMGLTSIDPRWGVVHEDGSPFPGEDHPAMVALRTGQVVRNVVMGIHNSAVGAHRWAVVSAVPQFRPGESSPFQVYATIDDHTEIISLRHEKDQIFSLSQDIICIVTFEARFRYFNEALCRILGFDREELMAHTFMDYVHPEDRDTTVAAMGVLFEGHRVHGFENRYLAADGRVVWLSWSSTPDMEDHLIYAIARDVTDHKRFERELQSAKEDAERANRAKSEFLANMSHEIRTPLNAVTGFSELLSNLLVDEKQKQYADFIRIAGRSLLTLINDILDLSKIEAGMLVIDPHPVSVAGLFEELRTIFTMKAHESRLEYRVVCAAEVPPFLELDEARLRQVLLNLVGNALKFTPSGSVALEASIQDRSGEVVDLAIRIRDTGIGIPSDQLDQVFESFRQQASQDVRVYGGTGLGLAISRRLVEMMGGRLTVESQEGVGSCFTVFLPGVVCAHPSETGPAGTVEVRQAAGTAPILVVDDWDSNRVLVREMLGASGLASCEARDGREAVRLALEMLPSLILMDMRMPEMDGIEAARLIRADERTRHIPIVALTASVSTAEVEEIRHEGFDGLLAKPVVLKALLEEVHKHLGGARPEGSLENVGDVADAAGLRGWLREDFLGRLDPLMSMIEIDRLRDIVEELRERARIHGAPFLARCAARLEQGLELFDVVVIRRVGADLDAFARVSDGKV